MEGGYEPWFPSVFVAHSHPVLQRLADAADAAAQAAVDEGELESKAEEAAEAQINIEALARQTSTAMMVPGKR